MIRQSTAALVLALLVVGCGGAPSSVAPSPGIGSPSATGSAAAASNVIAGRFDVGGFEMEIDCLGEGSPTVVLEAGLGGSGTTWLEIQDALAKTTRVCRYDRAGLGSSQPPTGGGTATVGSATRQLWALLAAAKVEGPYVLVGHSYGGMIVRFAAHEHPDTVRGLVLVDAASGHQFEGDWLKNDDEWFDGGVLVDRKTSAPQLAAVTTLGSIPLVVLTQGQMSGSFARDWSRFQDELATLSTDSLHMVAVKSGHLIPEEAPKLVVASAVAVIEAVRDSSALPPCGEPFVVAGAGCIAATLTAEVDRWDALRASVEPSAGTFPTGTYRAELSDKLVEQVTGDPQTFTTEVHTWTLSGGTWSVEIVTDGGAPDHFGGIYASKGDEIVFRLPDEWTIPRTPGVNRLRWSVDAAGTVHLTQIDAELPDPAFAVPWVPAP